MKIRRVMAVMLSLLMIAGVFCMPTAFAATGNFFEEEAAALDQRAYDGDDLGAVYHRNLQLLRCGRQQQVM